MSYIVSINHNNQCLYKVKPLIVGLGLVSYKKQLESLEGDYLRSAETPAGLLNLEAVTLRGMLKLVFSSRTDSAFEMQTEVVEYLQSRMSGEVSVSAKVHTVAATTPIPVSIPIPKPTANFKPTEYDHWINVAFQYMESWPDVAKTLQEQFKGLNTRQQAKLMHAEIRRHDMCQGPNRMSFDVAEEIEMLANIANKDSNLQYDRHWEPEPEGPVVQEAKEAKPVSVPVSTPIRDIYAEQDPDSKICATIEVCLRQHKDDEFVRILREELESKHRTQRQQAEYYQGICKAKGISIKEEVNDVSWAKVKLLLNGEAD